MSVLKSNGKSHDQGRIRAPSSSNSSNDRDARNENDTVTRRSHGRLSFEFTQAAWRFPSQRPLIGGSVFHPAALPSRARTRRLKRREMATASSSGSARAPPRNLGRNLMQNPHSTGQRSTGTSPVPVTSLASSKSRGSPSIATRNGRQSAADGADSRDSTTRTHLQAEITILTTLKHSGVGSGRTHRQTNTVVHATLERPAAGEAASVGSGSGARVTIDAVVETCDPTAGAGNGHRTIRTLRLASRRDGTGRADWKGEDAVLVLPKSTISRHPSGPKSLISAIGQPGSIGNAPGRRSIHQQAKAVSHDQSGLGRPWSARRAAIPDRQTLRIRIHPAFSHGNGQSRSVENLVSTGGPVPVARSTAIAPAKASSPFRPPVSSQISAPVSSRVSRPFPSRVSAQISAPLPPPVSSQISEPFLPALSLPGSLPSPTSSQLVRTSSRPATHFPHQFVTFRRYPHHAANPFMGAILPGSPAGAFDGLRFPQPGYFPPGQMLQGPVPYMNPTGAFYQVAPPSFTRHGVLHGLSWYLFTSSPFSASYPVVVRSDVGFPMPGGHTGGHNVVYQLRTGVPQLRAGGLRCPSQAPSQAPDSVPLQPPDASEHHIDYGLFIDTTLVIVLDDTFTMPVRVTFSARVVDDWIGQHSAQDRKLLGFDLEWRPNRTTGDDNKVAVLQLSGPRGCLIVQLLYMKSLPESLRKLFADVNVKHAGVGVMADFHKLYRDYGIVCTGAVELGFLASYTLGKGHLRHVGLAELSSEVLQLQGRFVKNKRVTLSDWAAWNLSRDQIQYAAADAFVAYRLLLVLKKKIELSASPDLYGLCL